MSREKIFYFSLDNGNPLGFPKHLLAMNDLDAGDVRLPGPLLSAWDRIMHIARAIFEGAAGGEGYEDGHLVEPFVG